MKPAARIDWERLSRSFVHPLKVSILEHLAEADEPLSAVDLGDALGTYAGRTKNHLNGLADAGLIELDHKVPVRGTHEHFYRLAGRS